MEENIISMFMDVKLDIRERKLEFSHLKSWTRYFVRIEAVKCFPCYMKISFFKAHTDENTDLVVRINIPGLSVQMATSRTRAHSYGLFWKNNRKRCCAYFALPSQLLCERHLRWMKKSIRNLELYRQEILQLRRASRTPMHEIKQEMQPNPSSNDFGIYQNLDITQNMGDVHDILGPLPNVPDPPSVTNLSRRISGVSGIYEEIFDPSRASNIPPSGPRMSRASIASGIYEEMKLGEFKEQEDNTGTDSTEDDTAPPLPPRPRSHTNEFEIQRSFTTPESDFLKKKKHWLLFESMFSRRRTNTNSDSSMAQADSKSARKNGSSTSVKPTLPSTSEKVVYRDKVARIRLAENKRNSFSSPDLSKLKIETNPIVSNDNLSDEGSCTSEFYVKSEVDYIDEDLFASSEFLDASKEPSIEESLADLLLTEGGNSAHMINVSEQIIPSFSTSCNTSSVNLARFSCAMEQKDSLPEPITSTLEGYCEMGAPGSGFNRQKLQNVVLRCEQPNEPIDESSTTESIYVNMEGRETGSDETSRSSSTSSGVSSIYSSRSTVCSTGKQRNSIDDKIPSYYPNEDFRTPKKPEASSVCNKETSIKDDITCKSVGKRSLYSTSSKSAQRTKTSAQPASSAARLSKSAQKPTKPRSTYRSISSDRCDQSYSPVTTANESPRKNSENNPPELATPILPQKYATIARSVSPSSSKYIERNSARKANERLTVGTKRFGSLPRFGKIDLSPLRLKINSVLQRHNADNT